MQSRFVFTRQEGRWKVSWLAYIKFLISMVMIIVVAESCYVTEINLNTAVLMFVLQLYSKDSVEFYFLSRNWSKNFWKRCIEYHAFFRCHTAQHNSRRCRSRSRMVSRGSSFRYWQPSLPDYIPTLAAVWFSVYLVALYMNDARSLSCERICIMCYAVCLFKLLLH